MVFYSCRVWGWDNRVLAGTVARRCTVLCVLKRTQDFVPFLSYPFSAHKTYKYTVFWADVDACIAFTDDIAARGKDVSVEVGTAADEEAESSARGIIEIRVNRVTHHVISDDMAEPVREDYPNHVSADGSLEVMRRGLDMVMQELYTHMVEISVHRFRVIESVQRDHGHRIVATSQQSAAMSEMISMLERDNMRLRGVLAVKRQRVDRLWRSMSYAQRDLRQIHSSSETSLDSHSDTSSNSSSRHSSSGPSISDSPCDSPTAIFARTSRKRR
nr:hypothetical protein [Tanacetum cinerariifolium]